MWVRIFGKTANYYNLVKQSTLIIVFSLLLHSLLWESQEILSLLSWLVRALHLVYFWSSVVYNSVTVCSATNFFSRNLFESPTNCMCSKVILSFFYIPKIILKLHLDGKLQVILAYYLYNKRDFSYCQTLFDF